jgi:hypothetical protein
VFAITVLLPLIFAYEPSVKHMEQIFERIEEEKRERRDYLNAGPTNIT